MQKVTPPRDAAGIARPLPLLVTQAVFLGLGCSVLYTVANTLFLERYGADKLPYVYLATAVTVPFVFLVPVARFARLTIGAFALLLLPARLALGAPRLVWVPFALMPLVVLSMQASMVVIGTQVSRIWDVQEVKRRYPLVMAGQIGGVILGGALVRPLAGFLGGVPNLLYLVTLAFALAALLVPRTEGVPATRPSETGRRGRTATPVRHLSRPYVVLLLVFRMLVEVASNLVNYLFLKQVEARFGGDEALAGFLGLFMAAATLLTLVFLVAAAGRILRRWGVAAGLAANPVAVGATLVLSAAAALIAGDGSLPLLVLILAARLANFVVVTGLTDPALKTAYQPLDPAQRLSVQTAVEGAGVPIAVGLTGAFLLAARAIGGVRPVHITGVAIVIMGALVLLARTTGKAYRSALERTLRGARLPPSRVTLDDAASREAATRLVDSGETPLVLLGVDLLERAGLGPDSTRLSALLTTADPVLTVELLARIERRGVIETLPAVRDLLRPDHPPAVRAAAARAIFALDTSADPATLEHLADTDPGVRHGAMIGLLRSRGIDGALGVAPALTDLLSSPVEADRIALAHIVAETAREDFVSPLAALLSDARVSVRRAALVAVARTRSPRTSPLVLRAIEDPGTRGDAMAALVALGDGIAPLVREAVGRVCALPRETALRVVRAGARAGGGLVTRIFADGLDHPDPEMRQEMARALSISGYRASPDDRKRLIAAIGRETEETRRLAGAAELLGTAGGPAEVVRALNEERVLALRRVAFLAGLLGAGNGVPAAFEHAGAADPKERALAREFLEVTLDREIRREATALLDPPRAPAPPADPERAAALIRQIADEPALWPYPWLRACAVHSLGRAHGGEPLVDLETVVLLKSSPIFAETPDRALASLVTLVERVEVGLGQTVIRKGDLERCLYVVATGSVRVHDGDRCIAVLDRGEIIGEMALLDPAPRSASVTALVDTVLFRLDKDAFDLAMADNPEIVHGVLRVLCRRLRTQIQRPAVAG